MQDDTNSPAAAAPEEEEQFDAPTGLDVLCGRGKPIQRHPGNRRFLEIVDVHRESYQNAPNRAEKKRVVELIVDRIHGDGGHFLQLDPAKGKYFKVEDKFIREKVSHALRSKKVETAASNSSNAGDSQTAPSPVTSSNSGAKQREEELHQKQRGIFQDLISSSEGRDGYGCDDEEMKVENDEPQVNQEGSHPIPNYVGSEPLNGVNQEKFDELLRQQRFNFERLIIMDNSRGAHGMAPGAPV